MIGFTKRLEQWWKSVDRVNLYIASIILLFGWLEMLSVGHAIAGRMGMAPRIFILKQTIFILMGFVTILVFSEISMNTIAILSIFLGLLMILFMLWILLFGERIKGAARWMQIFGATIQPSEILKPFFITANAMVLQNINENSKFGKGFIISNAIFLIIGSLLFLQPDIGMFFIYGFIWMMQMLVSNVPMRFFISITVMLPSVLLLAYINFSHVQYRINSFLSGDKSIVPYQVKQSLESISSGGLVGKGFGDGEVKYYIPDVHSDYIFAAIGEELGLIACMLLLFLYFVIIMKGMKHFARNTNNAKRIMGIGIISLLFIHVFISVSVSINMLPAKGTTLPFVSYGGSSMLSICIAYGMLLNLTRNEVYYDNVFERMKRKWFWDSLILQKGKK